MANLTTAQIKERLKGASKRELLELAQQLDALEKELNLSGPTTDDELHEWIKDSFGINIPRIAVCDGHCAPFDFLADLYFVRTTSALGMASRGGAKTFMVALLHRLNAEFKTKVESLTAGATEAQSKRAFAHLDKLVSMKGEKNILSKTKTEIVWRNGCKTEIVAGTKAAVNGPHPQIVHIDEVELMDPEVFDESRNMAQSVNIGGKLVPAQDIITSTRKGAIGPMQNLLNQIAEAKLNGSKPPYDLYTWCIFEVAQPKKDCQIAYPTSPCGTCDCDKITKGEWDDETPRTLADVCQGKFAKSGGWVVWDDVVRLFTGNSREVWEAQQQCSRPSTSGIVLPQFSSERNGIIKYVPNPDDGYIWQGIDFGATNPNAVLWIQVLNKDLEATGISGQKIVMKEGSHVFFDEFYKAEIPNAILAENIKRKEKAWSDILGIKFRVRGRFADPQGRAARLDLYHAGIPTTWHTDRDVKEQIKTAKELIEDKKFYVCTDRCTMMVDEIAYWHYPGKKKAGVIYDDPEIPVDDFDHTMSAMRYALANIKALGTQSNIGLPSATGDPQETAKRLQDLRDSLPHAAKNLPQTESWRLALGSPAMNPMDDPSMGAYSYGR